MSIFKSVHWLAFASLLLPGVAGSAWADDNGDAPYSKSADTLERLSGYALHGFANMGVAYDSSKDEHRRFARGAYLNNFDLYYAPDLGSRARFLSEIVFEPDSQTQQPSFDAERLQAGWVFNKNLTAWIGRFHTPIGYYVISYHHGMQLQTAFEKPRFLDFEDHYGVLPVHTNGIWLNGNLTVGDNRLSLMAWGGNADRMVTDGSGFTSLDFNMAHSSEAQLAIGARVNWIFGGSLDGLQIGATYLHEDVTYEGTGSPTYGPTGGTLDTTPNPNMVGATGFKNGSSAAYFNSKFNLYGVHLVYENHGVEFINEGYLFRDSSANFQPGTTWVSTAGFSQLAYWLNDANAPYARIESARFSREDPFFLGQYNGLPYGKYAAGFRHNVSETAAIKIEVSRTTFWASSQTNAGQNYNDVHVDYSIRF